MTAQATRQRSDLVQDYFDRLAATPQPLLHDVTATIRIDIDEHGGDARTWLLRIDHGRMSVSRRAVKADAVIRTDRAFFEQMITGEANSLTAALRGRLRMEGDIRLLAVFGQTLPGPPGGSTIVPPADRTARESARATKSAGTTTRTAKFSAAAARAARKDRAR